MNTAKLTILETDEQTLSLPLSNSEIRALVAHALASEQVNQSIQLSLTFTDEPHMQEINRQFRNVDLPTDVISIELERPEETFSDTPCMLGDIIICPQFVADEATRLEMPQKELFSRMIVHGLLHLLGYDHIEDTDARIMEAKEDAILDAFKEQA